MAYHHGRLVLYEQNDWGDNQSFASPLWYCKRTMDYGSDSLWGLVGEASRCDRADSMVFFFKIIMRIIDEKRALTTLGVYLESKTIKL